MQTINKKEFFCKYDINDELFSSTGLDFGLLQSIYCDYIEKESEFLTAANSIVEYLRQIKEVHSIKFRIKEPEHLIEKIIRKKAKDPSRDITLETYRIEIADLIGVRALHLFKDEWLNIHNMIALTWNMHETPKAYIRKGDSESNFKENGCDIEFHDAGYRSIHYLIESQPTKYKFITEIQVRTIFEEGWSEIDHKLRYPYDIDNVFLAEYLAIFNRLAGSADEMGTYIKRLKTVLDEKETEYRNELIAREKEQKRILSELEILKSKLKSETDDKRRLQDIIDSVSKSTSVLGPAAVIFSPVSSASSATLSSFLKSLGDTPFSSSLIATNTICSKCGRDYGPTVAFNTSRKCPECNSK